MTRALCWWLSAPLSGRTATAIVLGIWLVIAGVLLATQRVAAH